MNGGRVRTLLLAGFAVVALTGCELKDDGDNLVNGKTLFVQECSSCHTLARASAKGVVGPDLDEAWQQSEKDGLGRSTFEGLVHKQILHPNRNAQFDSETGKPLQLMPAELVKGEDAQDVAAYVASAAAAPGEDPGRARRRGRRQAGGDGQGRGREARDPRRRRADLQVRRRGGARRPAGRSIRSTTSPRTTTSPSTAAASTRRARSSTDGATSTVEVDLKAGEYAFYCSVPGHREGGMEGKLTVK